MKGGPFKSILAMRLSPEGPPVHGKAWVVSGKEDTTAFVKLIRGLFKRNDLVAYVC